MHLKYALKNVTISEREATTILVISALSGFILSFRRWGTTQFDASEGISNLIIFAVVFLMLYIIFIYIQKLVALMHGLEAKVDVWKYGLPLGVLITIMSYGLIPFVFVGGVKLYEIPKLRIGGFRKTVVNIQEMMVVGLSGPLVLILLSLIIFYPLFLLTGNLLFLDVVWITSIILIVSALPLPSLNGINVLLKSRTLWLMYLLYSLFLFTLLQFLEHIAIYALALVLSLITAVLIRRTIRKY